MTENIIKIMRGKLTQKELADMVGRTQAAIAKYESGRMPKKEILDKIASVTGYKIVLSIEKNEKEGKE